jgi:uncharacterized membrane protein YgaE (UPF0421/DUF939 family)
MRKIQKIHIGPRTLKTAAAAIIAMVIVEACGTTDSKLIFAMLGAMSAVQTTFKASLESCLTQIVGVLFGAVVGVVLVALSLPALVTAGIGIVLVITVYNALGIRFAPGLPCMIVVMLCTTPDVQAFPYALGRIWDTAIGLAVGMVINTLILPYDNRRQIRATAQSLDRQVISFLEEMFDGDDILPDPDTMAKQISILADQLAVFSDQTLLRNRRRDLENFRLCERKARELLARMTVLSQVERPGRLNDENRQRLKACGANILDNWPLKNPHERDMVTNYHVRQILHLRVDILDAIKLLDKNK